MAAYKVIGAHKVGGCAPGGTVEIEDEADAARLIGGGHIEPKTRSKPKTPEGEETKEP